MTMGAIEFIAPAAAAPAVPKDRWHVPAALADIAVRSEAALARLPRQPAADRRGMIIDIVV